MATQGTKTQAYESSTPELPFGIRAEEFFNLNGWGNGNRVQPNQGHGIALPLFYFGGGDKLLPNEQRPFYMSVKAQEGEADTVWVHYFDGLSLTPEAVKDKGVVLFNADPRKSSMHAAYFHNGNKDIDTDFATKKSTQMFFAQRVVPYRFATEEDFMVAATTILTEPVAAQALLDRADIGFDRPQFVARLISSYTERYRVWDEVAVGRKSFPKFRLDSNTIQFAIDELVPNNSNEESLQRFIADAGELFKGFCLEVVRSEDDDEVISVGEVSQETLARGFALIIRNFNDHDHNPSAIWKAVPAIRDLCGEACDEVIASKLVSDVLRASSRYAVQVAPEVEGILAQLSTEAQAEFYKDVFRDAADILVYDSRSARRKDYTAPIVFALRGAGNGLVLDDKARIKVYEALSDPQELAFALSTNPDVEFVAGLLAEQAYSKSRSYGYAFLYRAEDWSIGTANEEYREQLGLEFARQYCARLTARPLADAPVASESYSRDERIEFETRGFVNQLAAGTGISQFIREYGGTLGAHRDQNKQVIDFLFINGNAKDQLALADSGCLDPKVADRVRKNFGDQLFGRESRKALEGLADVIADDTDFDTGEMHSYLEGLIRDRRVSNGDEYRRTRIALAGTPRYSPDPRPAELPAPVRTLEITL